MKQIKTVKGVLDYAADFDREVNEALAEGWELKQRACIPSYTSSSFTALYAELEREVITEAERCCENCRYYDANPEAEPCASCSDDCDKWEE